MNIRTRMESSIPGLVTAAGLGAIAAVHAAWAEGSTWPRTSPDELADLVVGRRPFPSPEATWTVAGLLVVAAASTGIAAARPSGLDGRARSVAIAGATVTAAALLLRGVGGLVVSGAGLLTATEEFRRHDLALYSPLCLGLGAGAAMAARAAARPGAAS